MPPKTSPTSSNTPRKPTPSAAKNTYLILYNALSAALWAGVLYKTAIVGTHEVLHGGSKGFFQFRKDRYGGLETLGSGKVYGELERYTRLTQTLAGLEVVHSLFGIVRSPLLTTLMQVASRYLLVWFVAAPSAFPSSVRISPAYSTMLLAWSITETIRYSYFVFNLSGVGVPKLWTWLRYNPFLVLYPLGAGSEAWLMWKSIGEASKRNELYGWGLYAMLAIYVPGFYVLYTHMLKQRRRVRREGRRSV